VSATFSVPSHRRLTAPRVVDAARWSKQLVGHVIETDTVVPVECGQEISELLYPMHFQA
jgi:hypothetical protein